MKRVLVTRSIPNNGLMLLENAGVTLDVWSEPLPPPRDVLLTRAKGVHGVLSMLSDGIDSEFMDAAGPQLRVVSNFAVGVNNIDLVEAAKRGIQVGHTPDVLTDATADLAFGLLLASARRFGEGMAAVRNGHWHTWEPTGYIGTDLRGKTIGIYGMGRIGAAVARRAARGWDMKVLYGSRSPHPELCKDFDATHVDFDTLLKDADYISLHAPLTPETYKVFGAEAFARMKSTAVFINTARGGLCDENALAAALSSGQIFAAGLDVTDPEPIVRDSPLLGLPNCLIVPHIGSATIESRSAMSTIAAENIIRGIRGEPLRCAVN